MPKSRRLSACVTSWLRSPYAIAISASLGIYLGLGQPHIAQSITPFGELYLGLLKMCVLPILLSTVTGSIGRLLNTQGAGRSIQRMFTVFPVALLLVSCIAVVAASLTGPGRNLPEATLETLGVLVNQSGMDLEISLSGEIPEPGPPAITQLMLNLVPDNIFSALSEGQMLKVLVFSVIFGIALGCVQDPVTETLFEILESIYKACNRLIQALTLLLPIGLCSLLAAQLSHLGVSMLFSMFRFILVTVSTFLGIYVLNTLIIWRRSHQSLATVLLKLKEPTFLALATSSSLACIPSAITVLTDELHFDRQTSQLVTPLAITVCRFGSVVYFALATLFVAQLYHRTLSLEELMTVILVSILAGMATSGATGVLTLTMLDIVLNPLRLPLEAVLVLFIAIDPIIDPFRTLGIVHTGITATAMVADPARSAAKLPTQNSEFEMQNYPVVDEH
jgi:proton glutamate symport protein